MNEQKNIQTHLSKIAHINLLLAVCALVGVGVIYAWFRFSMHPASITNTNSNANTNAKTNTHAVAKQNSNTAPAQAATPEDIAKVTQEYQSSVNAILKDVDMSDAAKAKELNDQIALLHVPASLRTLQIQIIVALQEAQDGKTEDANTRIAKLRADYSWFTQ